MTMTKVLVLICFVSFENSLDWWLCVAGVLAGSLSLGTILTLNHSLLMISAVSLQVRVTAPASAAIGPRPPAGRARHSSQILFGTCGPGDLRMNSNTNQGEGSTILI